MTSETGNLLVDKYLASLTDKHGEAIPIDVVASAIEALVQVMEAQQKRAAGMPTKKLDETFTTLQRVQSKISNFSDTLATAAEIPFANDELEAVVSGTEAAANAILDVAEKLELVADTLPEEGAAAVHNIAAELFNAMTFQDLVGQRVNKVTNTLNNLELRIAALGEVFGHTTPLIKQAHAASAVNEEPDVDERDLLNGPALPGEAKSQDDIDALFGDD